MPVVHCKKDDFDIYIGRPSRWGNPYSHRPGKNVILVETREQAVNMYKKYLWAQIKAGKVSLQELAELDNKTLGCWCAPQACHGEVLLDAAKWAKQRITTDNS